MPEDASNLGGVAINTRKVGNTQQWRTLEFSCETKVPSTIGIFLIKDSVLVYDRAPGDEFATVHNVDISNVVTLPNGCYRFFYFVKGESGKILTKGHYDVEIIN